MDKVELSQTESRELEALLQPYVDAGLLESWVVDEIVHYRMTEFGRAVPSHAWGEFAAPDVRRH